MVVGPKYSDTLLAAKNDKNEEMSYCRNRSYLLRIWYRNNHKWYCRSD